MAREGATSNRMLESWMAMAGAKPFVTQDVKETRAAMARVYDEAHQAILADRDDAKLGRIAPYPTTVDWSKLTNGRLA